MNSRGHKYWYIIESRGINGKPRPIVLAYPSKANNLLRRLKGFTEGLRLKSYSHGAVAALLNMAHKLDATTIINKLCKDTRIIYGQKAYYGQSMIEHAFKNHYHIALRPQYHWTDQKIEVHFFICVL